MLIKEFPRRRQC